MKLFHGGHRKKQLAETMPVVEMDFQRMSQKGPESSGERSLESVGSKQLQYFKDQE